MDFYSIFKLLHVIAALAWVGGGLTMFVQTLFNVRDNGELATLRNAGAAATMGKRWFMPASALTLLFGLLTTWQGNLWSELWIILGLIGFATTFLTGVLVFERMGRRMGAALAAGDDATALRFGRMILRAGKFDYTVMFLIVADMVLKPSIHDVGTLAAMSAILLLGAGLFLIAPARKSDEPRMA